MENGRTLPKGDKKNQSAIVIGASSGIGRELAKLLASKHYDLGLVARRDNLLVDLQKELAAKSYVQSMDISDLDDSKKKFQALIQAMGQVSLIVIAASIGEITQDLNWIEDKSTIDTNVIGVTFIIHLAMEHFMNQGKGQLVVLSSVAALRGSAYSLSYNASKSFISNYLEGLQAFVFKKKLPIFISDVRPGFVETRMAKGEGLFWVQPVPKITKQIWKAIVHKKEVVYVSKRWRLLAFFYRVLPKWVLKRL